MSDTVLDEKVISRYAVIPHVYPAKTVYTILDDQTKQYIYGRDDQALVENKCAALNRGEVVDLDEPPMKELVKAKKPRAQNGDQTTLDEVDE